MELHPVAQRLLAILHCWEKKSPFPLRVQSPGGMTRLQEKATHPRICGQHKLALMGEKTDEKMGGKRSKGEPLKSCRRESECNQKFIA